jgi:hypothetical protein
MFAPHPVSDAPEPAIDAADAGLEGDLALLDRLARKGVAMAGAVKEDGAKDSAHAFDKLSRAVRLTLLLKAKLRAGPAAWSAAGVSRARSPAKAPAAPADAEPNAEAADPYAALKTGTKAQVRELVRDVIDRETPDPDENDTVVDALEERLLCDEAYDDIEGLPLRDIVEHLCDDLELEPDWSRWTGKGWEPNPPFHRPLCSDFRTPSRSPILNDAPDDAPWPHPLE